MTPWDKIQSDWEGTEDRIAAQVFVLNDVMLVLHYVEEEQPLSVGTQEIIFQALS